MKVIKSIFQKVLYLSNSIMNFTLAVFILGAEIAKLFDERLEEKIRRKKEKANKSAITDSVA
jgi:hypothetical protein